MRSDRLKQSGASHAGQVLTGWRSLRGQVRRWLQALGDLVSPAPSPVPVPIRRRDEPTRRIRR
jgi:hypothetical protein